MTTYKIKTAPETPDAGYDLKDDLRHRPQAQKGMRDSLFWEMIMPDEQIGFQAYLYLSGSGKAGFNIVVWGKDEKPLVLDLEQGTIADDMDLDDFSFAGLHLVQAHPHHSAVLRYTSKNVALELSYAALHAPFSYRQNPDGLPDWFAINRFEQTGWIKGFLEFGGRRISFDRIGHRDHSWGVRNWGVPQHWKWFIAYTPDGSHIVNGWIWIARGEWGFGGYIVRDGELLPISHIRHHAEYDADMTQRRLTAELVDVRGRSTSLLLERFGVVKLPSNDKLGTTVIEAACTASIDGFEGAGQFETHWPTSYLDHLIESAKGRNL
jgi:hypothetical protein